MNANIPKKEITARNPMRTLAPLAAGTSGAALVSAALLMNPSSAQALGFRIPNQDAEAIARGNAFTATANNPSAIYYNPAGITQLDGQNLQFGLHALSLNSFYEGQGKTAESKPSVQPVPQLYWTYTPKDYPVSFGMGLYAPYGMALEWPDDSPFRQGSIYYGSLTYITFNPVVAWKVTDSLSIAAGPTLNYSQVLLRQGVPVAGADPFQFRGDGYDFSAKCGVLWQPLEKWSFGAQYHGATTIKYDGHASIPNSSVNTSAEVPFARFFSVGASYRPTKDWNFELDVDWTDWHSMKTITIKNSPLGPAPVPLNWQSSFLVELGGTRYLQNGYLVSAGYFFSQNSTSDANFTTVVPDTNLHVGSVGFGHQGEHLSWMLAAQVIAGPDRVVSTAMDPAANGSYHWLNGSLNFSVRYHF